MTGFCRFYSRVYVRRVTRVFQTRQHCASHSEAVTAIRRKERTR